jgi:hypothetical protein
MKEANLEEGLKNPNSVPEWEWADEGVDGLDCHLRRIGIRSKGPG